MILVPVKATETQCQTINLLTDNGNKFASIDKRGRIKVFGEDSYLEISEIKDILKISDNFDLFFKNIKTQ